MAAVRVLDASTHCTLSLGCTPRGHFLLMRLEILPTAVIALNYAEIEAVMQTLVENATFASLLGNPAHHAREAQAVANLAPENLVLSYIDRVLEAREIHVFESHGGVARTESPSTP